ncbi:MAG: TonB-dependent receptor [Polyangiales bacterium]
MSFIIILFLVGLVGLHRGLAQAQADAGIALDADDLRGLDGGLSAPVADPPQMDVISPSEPGVLEVRARSGKAEALRSSSQAVTVIDLERARRGAADLGEVLARSEGVSIQRAGGLGSQTRFSLAGFEGEQIRFFLDGVPLALAGFPFGIENVPVNLVERVEIYRGVVPIRFGADALGGAVNLVARRPPPGNHGSVSYQGGSFDTHRLSAQLSHVDRERGRYALASGFFDRSRNDYTVDAPFTNAMNMPDRARVRRFHDAYTAGGASVEAGVLDRGWAERLSGRVFFTDMTQDLQSDLYMVRSYGEATRGALGTGSTLVYKQTFAHDLKLELIGNYAYQQLYVKDTSRCSYDWFGNCVTMVSEPGEVNGLIGNEPYLYAHTASLRANAEAPFLRHHALLASFAPNVDHRTGEDRSPTRPNQIDPLDVARNLYDFVSGLSYRLRALDERFEGEAFVKQYTQLVRAEVSAGATLVDESRNTRKPGAGLSLRYRWLPWLLSKASYEWATRLPMASELLGNGFDTQGNVYLLPERSHNLNYELMLEGKAGSTGDYMLELIGFQRYVDELIFAQSAGVFRMYRNVGSVKTRGVQSRARWTSPGNYLTLDGNLTYQDLRNESREGPFADYRGDRIPNRPYLMGTVLARVELSELFVPRDQVWLSWVMRGVGEFDRTWQSVGANRFLIERQLLHNLTLTYQVRSAQRRTISTSLDILNITDAKSFDFFGAQRPGRAVFFKTVIEI